MAIVVAVAVLSLIPVAFIISNSFMSDGEAAARYTSKITPESSFGFIYNNIHYMDMGFVPDVISLSAWRLILAQDPTHLRFLWNSLILAIPIVLGQLIIAPLAAYGLERAKSKHKEKFFFAYIIIMLLPMQALLVPHFIMAEFLGISGNYAAIIFPAIFATFGVFLIRQQMKGFRKEIIEAAAIDGAKELQIFLRIVLPNIKPTLVALAVLTFAEAWNIVDQAVVFIRDPYQMPLSVHLSTGLAGNMGIVFALSTLLMLPALIIFIYGQDDLSEGVIK
ncbi:MAG: carbohydrate ABC transporter permease [Clostridiales bacterium]|nr:carbohydrate ABC transporter permease [Clostridiales bacterium]